MWRYITLVLSAFGLTVLLIACGENKQTTATNPYATNNGCPAGTVYTNGFCYNQTGNQWGYTGTSTNFVSDNYNKKDVKITDTATYKNFLKKAMQVCDQANSNGGIYSCDSWAVGQFQLNVQMAATSSTALRATFSAYPQTNSYYWYGYSLPSASDFFYGMFGFPVYTATIITLNPLPIDNMVVSLINDSKGFEARAYGDARTVANRSLIQLQVLEGKLEQSAFDYQVGFEGKIFAKGRLQRY
mgnify:FL=1